MCAGIHHPTRGGTRGGKDQFDWDDVKTDKDRECYLGHSLMAPVGRWQKGKDLTWYTKKSKTKDFSAILAAEREAVKMAEENAMASALGIKPEIKTQKPLSKQETTDVFRRQSQEDRDGEEERIKGVGFSGGTRQRKRTDSSSNNLKSMFEHDTASDVKGSMIPQTSHEEKADSSAACSSTDRHQLRAKLKSYLLKKSKSKKREKRVHSDRKKVRRTSSSDSQDEWVESTTKVKRSHSERHRDSTSSRTAKDKRNGDKRKKR